MGANSTRKVLCVDGGSWLSIILNWWQLSIKYAQVCVGYWFTFFVNDKKNCFSQIHFLDWYVHLCSCIQSQFTLGIRCCCGKKDSNCMFPHYSVVIMGTMVSQITSLLIVYSTVYSGADQRKHQTSASLAFVRGINRWPVNFRHKGPVTWKMFPLDDYHESDTWWSWPSYIFTPPQQTSITVMIWQNE